MYEIHLQRHCTSCVRTEPDQDVELQDVVVCWCFEMFNLNLGYALMRYAVSRIQ